MRYSLCRACPRAELHRARTRVRCAGGRYRADGHSEARYEPGSDRRVLSNLLGIRSAREMDRAEERELVRATGWALHAYESERRISVEDLRDLHRKWLGGIYPWAGEYRQVNVSKGGFMFAAAGQIPRLMQEFEISCLAQYTPLVDARSEIPLALAETHTELLLIHPFREGNGRLARLLAKLMSLQAGVEIADFESLVQRRRAEYFAAVRAGLDRNYKPMRRLFQSIIDGDEG
jgi:cell filamentation protein